MNRARPLVSLLFASIIAAGLSASCGRDRTEEFPDAGTDDAGTHDAGNGGGSGGGGPAAAAAVVQAAASQAAPADLLPESWAS